MGEAGQADLSIVLVAWHGDAALEQAWRAIAREVGTATNTAEVIVVRGADRAPMLPGPTAGLVHRDLAMPPGTPVPQLRAAGIQFASGRRVVLLEDHCPLAPGWLAAHRSADRSWPEAILGGAVRQSPGASAASWAVYCFDYAGLATPGDGAHQPDPSGCNVSLPRAILEATRPVWTRGWHEGAYWIAARALAVPVRLVPGMGVIHSDGATWRRVVSQGWHHGRLQGAVLGEQRTRSWQVARLLATPLLLVWLPVRRLAACLRCGAPRTAGRLASVPLLVVLLAAWTLGEAMGLLRGAGRSASAWR